MKNIRFWANLSVAIALIYVASSCAGSRDYLSNNFQQVRASHHVVAVLPFDVRFPNNTNYNSYRRDQQESIDKNGGNTPHLTWSKQEQQGSLDMQRDLFIAMNKQVQKGRYDLAVQDFNKTNKILESNNVMLNDIAAQDKGKLAQLLGVDAVIWGQTVVNITHATRNSPYGYGRYKDGVETTASLYDAMTSEMLWSTNQTERPSSNYYSYYAYRPTMDTPHDLADRILNYVAKNLPYRMAKR